MLDFVTEQWFVEAIMYMASGAIIGYGLCWLFEQIQEK
jgi:hypothetical protein